MLIVNKQTKKKTADTATNFVVYKERKRTNLSVLNFYVALTNTKNVFLPALDYYRYKFWYMNQ